MKNYDSDELRGCIGFPEPIETLVKATITSAIEAATGDPRFPQVTLKELEKDIVIEVSVLTTPSEITTEPKDIPKNVVIGRDGLIIGKGLQRGLFIERIIVGTGTVCRARILVGCAESSKRINSTDLHRSSMRPAVDVER